MPRQDTKLEAEGAEFLVLGQLLLQRIPTYKTYTNMRGYDLVATNPETNKSGANPSQESMENRRSVLP